MHYPHWGFSRHPTEADSSGRLLSIAAAVNIGVVEGGITRGTLQRAPTHLPSNYPIEIASPRRRRVRNDGTKKGECHLPLRELIFFNLLFVTVVSCLYFSLFPY